MPGWLKRGKTSAEEPQKPLLRGVMHKCGFFVFAAMGSYVLYKCEDHLKKMAFFVYLMSSLCLYATSSTYHTTKWHHDKIELLMQKLDHSVIILQISGTYTPVCMSNFPVNETWPRYVLGSVWLLTICGFFKAWYWDNPPKIFNVAFYFFAGLNLVPFLPRIVRALSPFEWVSFALAGAIYLLGGTIYGLETPDPSPQLFGFHEIFHLCTLTANLFFFLPIASVTLKNQ